MNQVLSILTGEQVDSSVIDRGYCGNSQQYAGCFIKTDKVYSICNGVVLAAEKYEGEVETDALGKKFNEFCRSILHISADRTSRAASMFRVNC